MGGFYDTGTKCNSFLDKPGNDFERGDWMEYYSHELHEDCREFSISTYDLRVSVINHGSDALCIDRSVLIF